MAEIYCMFTVCRYGISFITGDYVFQSNVISDYVKRNLDITNYLKINTMMVLYYLNDIEFKFRYIH